MGSNFFSHLGVAAVRGMRFVPLRLRRALAELLARLMWALLSDRRHVALTNLRLCFPEMAEDERERIARGVFRNLACATLDHGVLWAGSHEDVERLIRYEGLDELKQHLGEPILIISPHFLGLDAAGIGLCQHARGCSIYQRQTNPVWDKAAYEGRTRFGNPVLLAKTGHGQDMKAIVRLMREGLPFYYLPDMDHGRSNSIFVPFFGVPAATVAMASRLARVTRARVYMCVAEITPEGYTVHLTEPWKDFPSSDPEADTLRVTQELERWVRRFPDQYLWTHRRFKTRPEGEPSVY